jgi:nucleotide-binding universal stress UspA family protein
MNGRAGNADIGNEEPMTTIKRILYATDLSPISEPAWHEARRFGGLFDAEILLVHVVPSVTLPLEGYFPPHMYDELVQSARREAEARFDRLLGSVPGSGLKVRIRLEEGAPAQRILAVAQEERTDVVIVGTHGRAGLQRALLGSVADRLVRQAPCPVVTVQPALGAKLGAKIQRICYATDFSPTARAAWPWVVSIASAADAEIDLVHVTFSPVPDRHLSAEALGRMAHTLHEQGRLEAQRFLEKSPFPGGRINVRLSHGDPGEQVVHQAQAQSADLIVMGTHGWSGLVRWMLGSVAHHVIQTAPCPVLTVAPSSVSEQGAESQGAGR